MLLHVIHNHKWFACRHRHLLIKFNFAFRLVVCPPCTSLGRIHIPSYPFFFFFFFQILMKYACRRAKIAATCLSMHIPCATAMLIAMIWVTAAMTLRSTVQGESQSRNVLAIVAIFLLMTRAIAMHPAKNTEIAALIMFRCAGVRARARVSKYMLCISVRCSAVAVPAYQLVHA